MNDPVWILPEVFAPSMTVYCPSLAVVLPFGMPAC